MKDVIEYDDLNIGLLDQTDEYVVLYESDDKTERIVLFRNIQRQIEYILLSPSLLCSDDSKFLTRNYLD